MRGIELNRGEATYRGRKGEEDAMRLVGRGKEIQGGEQTREKFV